MPGHPVPLKLAVVLNAPALARDVQALLSIVGRLFPSRLGFQQSQILRRVTTRERDRGRRLLEIEVALRIDRTAQDLAHRGALAILADSITDAGKLLHVDSGARAADGSACGRSSGVMRGNGLIAMTYLRGAAAAKCGAERLRAGTEQAPEVGCILLASLGNHLVGGDVARRDVAQALCLTGRDVAEHIADIGAVARLQASSSRASLTISARLLTVDACDVATTLAVDIGQGPLAPEMPVAAPPVACSCGLHEAGEAIKILTVFRARQAPGAVAERLQCIARTGNAQSRRIGHGVACRLIDLELITGRSGESLLRARDTLWAL